jgi:hypothetical protein
MHEGIWATDQEVMDKNEGAIVDIFEDAIAKELNK